MELTINLATIVSTITGSLVVYGIKSFAGRLTSIDTKLATQTEQLAKQNGRIGKIETWAEQHEKSDDERHVEVREWLKSLSQSVNNPGGTT
jgi:predicted PurR-regulated permease PerM